MTFMKHSKLVLVFFIGIIFAACGESTTAPPKEGSASSPAKVTKAAAIPMLQDGDEIAVIETDFGKIKLQLFSDVAPKHVENFKKLINAGFYNGLAFHRAIPDLIIQGGDPNTKNGERDTWGMGQPEQPKINAEFNDRPFIKGTLGAARGGEVNSASSQFFICAAPNPQWDGQYTNFGQVIEGQSNVQVMTRTEIDAKQLVKEKMVINKMYLEKYKKK
jgi:peptidyl-prolyl cis-trans isomerase B (cyclophilin B)